MKNVLVVLLFSVLFGGCTPEIDNPIAQAVIDLRVDPEKLICNLRHESNYQRLDFHYSQSTQEFGQMLTFRIIGKGFEVILVNDEKANEFHLTAYDLSRGGGAAEPAIKAFHFFKRRLNESRLLECSKLPA